MRTIEFANDDESKQRFEVLFHGLIVTGNTNTQKGLIILNRELSLLDKFESISRPCECGKKLPGLDESDRELDFGDDPKLMLSLDGNEEDLLYEYVSKVPWSIGKPARLALKTLHWLRNGSSSS